MELTVISAAKRILWCMLVLAPLALAGCCCCHF